MNKLQLFKNNGLRRVYVHTFKLLVGYIFLMSIGDYLNKQGLLYDGFGKIYFYYENVIVSVNECCNICWTDLTKIVHEAG